MQVETPGVSAKADEQDTIWTITTSHKKQKLQLSLNSEISECSKL